MYLKSAFKIIKRGIKTTPALCDSSFTRRLANFKKMQADFQIDDGRPVFLKGGVVDRGLYIATLLACTAGVVLSLVVIYDNAKPNSWKKPQCP